MKKSIEKQLLALNMKGKTIKLYDYIFDYFLKNDSHPVVMTQEHMGRWLDLPQTAAREHLMKLIRKGVVKREMAEDMRLSYYTQLILE